MGYTALILAAMGGGVAAVKVLLEAGVDLDAMDEVSPNYIGLRSILSYVGAV